MAVFLAESPGPLPVIRSRRLRTLCSHVCPSARWPTGKADLSVEPWPGRPVTPSLSPPGAQKESPGTRERGWGKLLWPFCVRGQFSALGTKNSDPHQKNCVTHVLCPDLPLTYYHAPCLPKCCTLLSLSILGLSVCLYKQIRIDQRGSTRKAFSWSWEAGRVGVQISFQNPHNKTRYYLIRHWQDANILEHEVELIGSLGQNRLSGDMLEPMWARKTNPYSALRRPTRATRDFLGLSQEDTAKRQEQHKGAASETDCCDSTECLAPALHQLETPA